MVAATTSNPKSTKIEKDIQHTQHTKFKGLYRASLSTVVVGDSNLYPRIRRLCS